MAVRVQEAASLRLDEIYRYTRERWGVEQAESQITTGSGRWGWCTAYTLPILLTWIADMQKPRGEAGRMALIYCIFLVAGTGFEPVTFRL